MYLGKWEFLSVQFSAVKRCEPSEQGSNLGVKFSFSLLPEHVEMAKGVMAFSTVTHNCFPLWSVPKEVSYLILLRYLFGSPNISSSYGASGKWYHTDLRLNFSSATCQVRGHS